MIAGVLFVGFLAWEWLRPEARENRARCGNVWSVR